MEHLIPSGPPSYAKASEGILPRATALQGLVLRSAQREAEWRMGCPPNRHPHVCARDWWTLILKGFRPSIVLACPPLCAHIGG
jgi:hypothetical protein